MPRPRGEGSQQLIRILTCIFSRLHSDHTLLCEAWIRRLATPQLISYKVDVVTACFIINIPTEH